MFAAASIPERIYVFRLRRIAQIKSIHTARVTSDALLRINARLMIRIALLDLYKA